MLLKYQFKKQTLSPTARALLKLLCFEIIQTFGRLNVGPCCVFAYKRKIERYELFTF